jgi:hypothetical protein
MIKLDHRNQDLEEQKQARLDGRIDYIRFRGNTFAGYVIFEH